MINQTWAWYCKKYTADALDGQEISTPNWCFFIGTKEELDEYIHWEEFGQGAVYFEITKRPLTMDQWIDFIYNYLVS